MFFDFAGREIRRIHIWRLILVLVLLFIGGYGYRGYKRSMGQAAPITSSELSSTDPFDFPFYDLTIPYLRERIYESSLGDSKEYSKSAEYTSYLTNFSSDNFRVNGLLTVPEGDIPEGGFPAIVLVHGYIPPSTYKTTDKYVSYVDYLAKNGFVVFKIDLRGHGDSEGTASGAYYSSDYVIDVLNAYSALQSADFVNPRRIGLWGHSMAGNIVFRSFVVKKDIPAVVIWAGAVYTYSDMAKFRINDNSYQPPANIPGRVRSREKLRKIYGEFDPENEFWKQVVPTNYLDGVTGAVEIHHLVDDDIVNIGYSRNLMEVLDNTSIPHELFEYQSGGHNITGPSFNKAMGETVEFYNENLQY